MRAMISILVLALVAMTAHGQERPVVTVYTYDSFSSDWGPGPAIKEAFEARCGCELKFVAVDSSTGILTRVLLEGKSSSADVVLGLDNSLIADARATGLLNPHNMDLSRLDLPFQWDDLEFVPFDYGFFAFIYDSSRLENPPSSFQALVDADDSLKILIQDPRSSTPGLGLMLWVKALYGDGAAAVWEKLSGKIVTVTKGWSEAYGLFLDGEADMVLSYTTSPAYHMIVEKEDRYQAAEFSEGHAMQIEVAAQLKNAPNPELAQQFMDFIASDEFQSAIPTGNWMYPAKYIEGGLPDAFGKLVQPKKTLLIDAAGISQNRSAWVDEFNRALSQ